jgi:hypothetical protein
VAEWRGSGRGLAGEQSGGSVVINRSPRRQDALTFRARVHRYMGLSVRNKIPKWRAAVQPTRLAALTNFRSSRQEFSCLELLPQCRFSLSRYPVSYSTFLQRPVLFPQNGFLSICAAPHDSRYIWESVSDCPSLPTPCSASRSDFGVLPFFPAESRASTMRAPSLRSSAVSQIPHWTVPVSREETLAVREKFRKIGWRKPNNKPNTTKVMAWAKTLWDRYLPPSGLLHRVASRFM